MGSQRSRAGTRRFALVLVALSAFARVEARADSASENLMPRTRVNPEYPDSLIAEGVEGWASVTFRVNAFGEVADPFISGSSGEPLIDRSVLNAVSRWTYPPAERCGVTVRLRLSLGRGERPTPPFRKRQRAIQEQIRAGDLEAAGRGLDALRAHRLAEVDLRSALEVELQFARGDREAEAAALQRLGSERGLGRKAAAAAATRRLALLAELKQYGSALVEARALRADDALPPEFAKLESQLMALPSGRQRLETPGRTSRRSALEDQPSVWSAPLTRQRFQIEAEGALSRGEVCCSGSAFAFNPGLEDARIPDDAHCHVRVFGEEGARFTLVEFPNEPASTTPAP